MSDEKALLAAIWAHPHEDTPRLMYADWLDEHGQGERAEFIRVQIEAANLPTFDPERASKAKRTRHLLAPHVEGWVEPFRWIFADLQPVAWSDRSPTSARLWGEVVGVTGYKGGNEMPDDYAPPELRFERGFVSEVTTALATIIARSPGTLPRSGPRPKLSVQWPYGGETVEVARVFPALRERLTFDNYSGWQFSGPGSLGPNELEVLVNEPDLAAGITSLDASLFRPRQSLYRILPLAKQLTHLTSSLSDGGAEDVLPLIRAAIGSKVNESLTDFAVVNLFSEPATIAAVVTELATAVWPKLKRILLYQWRERSCLTTGITAEPFPQLEEITLLGEAISRDQLTDVLECPAFRTARVRYFEYEEIKRPEILALEKLYSPRFQCRA
ncbi:MAG: TIGR02996 domain-containing protein [Planctomycetes bacterium]|nr:TIGR02996 domain-containing protein [Planctomycetota bacterium]